jgi:hypothetical protein
LFITSLIRRSMLVSLVILLAQVPFAHAGFVSLQPDTTFAADGESILVSLTIGGLGNFGPDSLGAFDLSVGFDPSVLTFTGYSLGGLLGDLGLSQALDASTGDGGSAINLAEVSLLSPAALDALQPDEFIVAVLGFDVSGLASGATTLLSILSGGLLVDADGATLPITGTSGASIVGIPLPATPLLFLVALFGLAATRRSIARGSL